MEVVEDNGLVDDQYLVLKVADEDIIDNEVLVENRLEDAEDGQVYARGLDVKTYLLDDDVLHIDDVLH